MMSSLRALLLLSAAILSFQSGSLRAQEDRRPKQQIADSVEIAALARSVTQDATTDSARAAALYSWVAQGVRYDVTSFLNGTATDDRAESVYRGRLAVCAGYVALYRRMATEVGLKTETIHGYAKGFNYVNGQATSKPNHSWVALKLGSDWKLIDPTWGSGTVNNGKFVPQFIWDYFMIAPAELQLSHFPEEAEWQLMKRPMSRREFEQMTAVPRNIIALGFNTDTLKHAAMVAAKRGFPLASNTTHDARVIRAPSLGTLDKSSPVTIDVIWPSAADVALVTGGKWTALSASNGHFQGQTIASGPDVMLVGRPDRNKPYETLLYYQVK